MVVVDGQPSRICNFTDVLPVLSQLKMGYLWARGDTQGAAATWDNYTTYSLVASQIAALYEVSTGEWDAAHQRQLDFLAGCWVFRRNIPRLTQAMPIVGHCVGVGFYIAGEKDAAKSAMLSATRSSVVLLAGVGAGACAVKFAGAAVFVAPVAVAAKIGFITGPVAGASFDWCVTGVKLNAATDEFDMCLRVLCDGLRATSGVELTMLLWPDTVTETIIFSEPLKTAIVSDGSHTTSVIPAEGGWTIPGVYHTYVEVNTMKGHIIITERLRDGIAFDDLGHPNMPHHFDHGHPVDGVKHSPHPDAKMHVEPQADDNLYLENMERWAQAQSRDEYCFMWNNCQHYVKNFADRFGDGIDIEDLPNGSSLAWANSVVAATKPQDFTPATLFELLSREASQAPDEIVGCSIVAVAPQPLGRAYD